MTRTLAGCDEPRIVIVPDARGYTAGWTLVCSCGHESHELRATPGLALIDHWKHLRDAVAMTKESA